MHIFQPKRNGKKLSWWPEDLVHPVAGREAHGDVVVVEDLVQEVQDLYGLLPPLALHLHQDEGRLTPVVCPLESVDKDALDFVHRVVWGASHHVHGEVL